MKLKISSLVIAGIVGLSLLAVLGFATSPPPKQLAAVANQGATKSTLIDFRACSTDSDCVQATVKDCCGTRPLCVSRVAQFDPETVLKKFCVAGVDCKRWPTPMAEPCECLNRLCLSKTDAVYVKSTLSTDPKLKQDILDPFKMLTDEMLK